MNSDNFGIDINHDIMKKLTFLIALLTIVVCGAKAQDSEEELVATLDELTADWDREADHLKTYEGLGKFCKTQAYRFKITGLLKDIHHYDSVLYKVVKEKYEKSRNPEAAKTLADIKKLESEYTTKAFLKFEHNECRTYNNMEQYYRNKKDSKGFKKEVKAVEKELTKYVKTVTDQIDLIDEHSHHLEEF